MSEIKLLTEDEYNALSITEKQAYIAYDPAVQSQAYNQFISDSSELVASYTQLVPIMEKLLPITKGTSTVSKPPSSSLVQQIDAYKGTSSSMKGKVDAIKSHPYASVTAEPLECLFNLVSMLSALIFSIFMSPASFMNTYQRTYNDTNTGDLKTNVVNNTIPNIKKNLDVVKAMNIPDPEIKAKVDQMTSEIEASCANIISQIELVDTMGSSIPNIEVTATQLSSACTLGLEAFTGNLTSPLMLDFNNLKIDPPIDPKISSSDVSKNMDTLLTSLPKKYIKSVDMKKIQES